MEDLNNNQIQELLQIKEKLEHKLAINRKNSNSYYNKNFVVKEDMTEDEIKQINENVEKRKQKARGKYNNNKQYHQIKNKKWRDKVKVLKLDGIEIDVPKDSIINEN